MSDAAGSSGTPPGAQATDTRAASATQPIGPWRTAGRLLLAATASLAVFLVATTGTAS